MNALRQLRLPRGHPSKQNNKAIDANELAPPATNSQGSAFAMPPGTFGLQRGMRAQQ
jgi:hypothetical protein